MELRLVEQSDRPILENLFSYYVYDLSEYMGWEPNADGVYTFNANSLDYYWQHDDHFPYFISINNQLSGFVLLRRYPQNKQYYDIEQFFILRAYKNQGVGKQVLKLLVQKHEGLWQVRVLTENKPALGFWISAIKELVGQNYKQTLDKDVDLEMHFIRFEYI